MAVASPCGWCVHCGRWDARRTYLHPPLWTVERSSRGAVVIVLPVHHERHAEMRHAVLCPLCPVSTSPIQ